MVDTHWKEHLLNLDHLKEGIGLRGYGQKNPLQEYKKEGFEMFSAMIETIREQTLSTLFRIKLASQEDLDREAMEKKKRERSQMRMSHGRDAEQAQQPLKREDGSSMMPAIISRTSWLSWPRQIRMISTKPDST